jgi:hypothetical protein
MSANEFYTLRVNGRTHQVQDSWVGESLLYASQEPKAHANKVNAAVAQCLWTTPQCVRVW